MIRSFSGRTRRWCALTGIAAVTVSQLAATPASAHARALANSAAAIGIHRHVTLLTGDEIDYIESKDGSRIARIDAATEPDRPAVSFETMTTPAGMFVYPSDAMPLVASGVVDRSLFNITELARNERASELPIFVRYQGDTAAAETLPATKKRTTVASLNGTGLLVAKSKTAEVWRSVKARAGGISRVSLDRTVRVNLDHSAAQVGAPAVWVTAAAPSSFPISSACCPS